MRKFVFVLFTLLSVFAHAQKNTLVDQAFWRGNPTLDQLKAEIAKGNSPSEAGPYGADATVYAINAQMPIEIIQFMLSQPGNDINKKVSNGRTYIYSAASKGNVPLLEYLITEGAKTDVRDNFGYTILTYSAAFGQTDTKVYDVLIAHGADPVKEKIAGGANAMLLLAPLDKDFSLINYFVSKGVDINSQDSVGATVFDYAVKSGNLAVLKQLVAKGVKYSSNALISAATGTRGGTATFEVYQYLVDQLNLDPKALSTNGDNVLHLIARRSKQEESIKYFLAKGVDVNQANADGVTPFMNAAAANTDVATISMLLPLVKNINQVSNNGASALALAVRRNTVDVVKLLLDKGADVNVIDSEGYNLAYYLVPTFALRPEAFEAKLKLLQEKGFDIAKTQKNGSTLYHLVLVKNGVTLLKRIEEYKVDVNAKDKEGLTPLHKAAMLAKDDAVLKYLIGIGAKKEATTEFKETAFDLAKENEFLTKQHISIDFLK